MSMTSATIATLQQETIRKGRIKKKVTSPTSETNRRTLTVGMN